MPIANPPSELVQKVNTALAGLGKTASEVAESLYKAGARGEKCVSHNCPITNFITSSVPEISCFVICQSFYCFSWTEVINEHRYNHNGSKVNVPSAVGQFIVSFDQGQFSQLQQEK